MYMLPRYDEDSDPSNDHLDNRVTTELAPDLANGDIYVRQLTHKRYEMKDHLGNVRVVISDLKVAPSGGRGPWAADILSWNNYYPFGMVQPDRHGNTEKYRYGFNGKEMDNEVHENPTTGTMGTGNSYDFGARMYDARVVQRPSPDPKWRDYPGQSSYAVFNGNPILYADPSGESGEVTIDKASKTITVTSHMVFYGGGATAELAKSTAADVQSKWNEAAGKVTISGVEYSVNFVVTGEHKAGLTPDEVTKNTDIKNNYIRVEEGNAVNISYMDGVGSNTGYYLVKNIKKDGSTTEAHEMGHGYGLVPGTHDGHPTEHDHRGKGRPGIMNARGTLVDEEYRYPGWEKSGYEGLNPEKRKVLQGDIDMLGLDKLKFDKDGKANLGKLTNEYHKDETPAKKP